MKNKIAPRIIYILTEGQTEVAYFHRISEIINDNTDGKYFLKVEVRDIEDGVRQDPRGLVNEAKIARKENGYSEVWVVFDKDRDREDEIKKAFDIAQRGKIKVAFSSISFEHWLILHYEKNTTAFLRSDCESRGGVCECNGQICASTYLKENFYPTFKKGYSLLYDDIKALQDNAIENSAWLRHYLTPYTDIVALNPYSDVDILVCTIFDIPIVKYVSLNEPFKFGNIEIEITGCRKNNQNIDITLSIFNGSKTAIPINPLQPFEIVDDGKNAFKYRVANNQTINPGQLAIVILMFNVYKNSHSLVFRAKSQNLVVFFQIP